MLGRVGAMCCCMYRASMSSVLPREGALHRVGMLNRTGVLHRASMLDKAGVLAAHGMSHEEQV